MTGMDERVARLILTKALLEERAGEFLDRLFAGDAVTIDAVTGNLVFATADMLKLMMGSTSEERVITEARKLLDRYPRTTQFVKLSGPLQEALDELDGDDDT